MILFTVFTFYPFAETILKSFFIVDSLGQIKQFVGFENYTYILSDEKFLRVIVNTLLFVVLTVPISKVLGLLLAILANKRRKTSSFYEASFAIPMAMASSVAAMIFQLLYVPSLGFLNGFFGIEVEWLNDPKMAMVSISIIQIWMSTGYAFIFMLSAVRGVSQEILENARLEGASPFRQIISIYIPLTSPIMFYLICTDIAYSMMMMSFVNILTEGGPNNATMTIMQYVFKQFTAAGNFTNANPAAIIAFIMTFIITMISFAWEKKGVHYQ
ncbi:carbohydrate ABC transporter permease [Paenibacillus sp. L3-i20]|uniref:carbohydrate ABC transporter permease n=1 Tax=Paenibacillus sp. L3-i20 TaxID=2905833 RepID=UPI001EDF0370|nr:sugar ABC transporter permease [Paenibacillus sp. L3-i20]GKU78055.1 glycerol-3-phosphate ABC transporter permease [Paenibacillus sp. L3-i20]